MVWKESICHVFKSLVHHCENFCQWENAVVHVKSCEPQGLVLTDYPFESGILWSLLCFCLGGCKWLNAVLISILLQLYCFLEWWAWTDFSIAIFLFGPILWQHVFTLIIFLVSLVLLMIWQQTYITRVSRMLVEAEIHHSPPPIASTLLAKTWKQIRCDQNHKI